MWVGTYIQLHRWKWYCGLFSVVLSGESVLPSEFIAVSCPVLLISKVKGTFFHGRGIKCIFLTIKFCKIEHTVIIV